MSDQGSTGGDVWIVSSAGGQPRDLSQGRPTSPAWIEWGSNDYLFVSELAGGNSQLIRYKLQGDRTGERIDHLWLANLQHSRQRRRRAAWRMSLSATADHSMFVFQRQHFRPSARRFTPPSPAQ